MAKKSASSLKHYNATIRAIKRESGVTQKEAQQAYRSAKVQLGRAPTAGDVKTKAVRESAKRAGAQLAAAKRAKEKYVRESIERAKAPRLKRGVAEPRPAPGRGRGGAPGAGDGGFGGGGGGGSIRTPGRGGEYRDYDPSDYEYLDPPDEMYGWEEGDSPEAGGK